MKLLPIFLILFILLSSSMAVAVATAPPSSMPLQSSLPNPDLMNQIFGIKVVNNTTTYSPFEQVINFVVGFNGTINGVTPLHGPEHYHFTWLLGPTVSMGAGTYDLFIQVRDGTKVIASTTQIDTDLSMYYVSGALNATFNITSGVYYFDLFGVPAGSSASWSNLWWGIQLNPPIVINHWHNQTIYSNTTVAKPYIPWIVYVIIGVLTASTVGFGVQGHEDEEKMRRRY